MSDVVSIDADVPVPARVPKYPYEALEVGESFLVTTMGLQSVCNANYRQSKRQGRKFVARKVEGGVRVWRVS